MYCTMLVEPQSEHNIFTHKWISHISRKEILIFNTVGTGCNKVNLILFHNNLISNIITAFVHTRSFLKTNKHQLFLKYLKSKEIHIVRK